MGFLGLCREIQLNPITLLADENISPTVLRSPDIQIPYASFVRVLNRAAAEGTQPLFGLSLSQRHGIETLGPLGLLAGQCKSLGDSIDVIQKYVHFHGQGVQLTLETEGDEAFLSFAVSLDREIPLTQLLELGVGRVRNVIQALAPEKMRISRVLFRHQPLAPQAEYERLLKTETRFVQSRDAVVFPAAYLQQPPTPASDKVRDFFEAFMKSVGQNQVRPLRQQVVKLIRELIPTGEANAPAVAQLLGVHTRQLQRELKSSDTDFRTLLEEVRFDLARDALCLSAVPLTDLALQLGYSELSAFSRAFKRWSGLSPQQWRDQHQDA